MQAGLITGVIGPNGAGKSTALRALYGLLKPVAGDVLIDGRKVTGLPPWKFIDHGIALVPQQRSLFNELSVDDNLGSPAGRSAATARASRRRWSAPMRSSRCCATSAATSPAR